ncbi:MAG: 2,3-bisphosphoglycerate-independent phosphoglycerate mutase [Candidatus Curtissbacteria bacterium]|nr:2,3-bisphosphoglycerate-independent phosphoglycerate mutase [Candidatus Curtissbacteria bacterium]
MKPSRIPKPLVLCILDGWGQAPPSPGNAITCANPLNFTSLWLNYPHTTLVTSGPGVGLPRGCVGNSEVGHLNLGAGRIVFQDLLRINSAITDGSFFTNEAFTGAINHYQKNGGNIHLMGLVGLGFVHSASSHLFALLSLLQKKLVPKEKIKLHLFTDGRDSPPTSAKAVISQLQEKLEKENLGQIASISGRYYSMDRDNRWERTAKAYFAMLGQTLNFKTDLEKAIVDSYADGKTDEFIEPFAITDQEGNPIGRIRQNDAIIFFNFRPDRARQLTKAFVLPSLDHQKAPSGDEVKTFEREPKIENLFFASMTRYEKGLPVSAVAFPPEEVEIPLAQIISERNMRQLHIAETEKYAHVTYFFNGGREEPFPGEDRVLVNSQKVASYDLAPGMSAPQITEKLISKIKSGIYDFIVLNLANADMVGHTGNFEATVKAVNEIDTCLKKISETTLGAGGGLIITADHGNAEVMVNAKTGQIDTAHNAGPAPCIFVIKELGGSSTDQSEGLLADVAPTILALLNIPKPSTMTGRSLLA